MEPAANLAQARIMVVDDRDDNLLIMEEILTEAGFTNIVCESDAREAMLHTTTDHPDLIVLDLMMPYYDGYAILERVQQLVQKDLFLPVVVLTADLSRSARERALKLGACDFLLKPVDPVEVVLRLTNLLQMRQIYLRLQAREQRGHEALLDAQHEMLERLALAAECHDELTGMHNRRVGLLAAEIAHALGQAEEFKELIGYAAQLHDIGKIGIPDAILQKPGVFTEAERAVMQQHTLIGAKILGGSTNKLLQFAEQIAATHHERWDGKGYPHGLQGLDIPLSGRIVALADTFDALLHQRPYKSAWPLVKVLDEIDAQRGRQFDPEIVTAFKSVMDDGTRFKAAADIDEQPFVNSQPIRAV